MAKVQLSVAFTESSESVNMQAIEWPQEKKKIPANL